MSNILLTAKAAQANAKAKSKVLLIAKAEIKAFWGSQAAALALILFLGLTGFFFYNNTAEYTAKALIAAGHAMSLDASVALFSQGLSHIAVAIMLTAPMLAMRALTPSRRGGRLDFYLGLPLSPRQILGGHYLAILFSMWVFIILALIPFAVLLAQFSVGSPAILASAALGLLLLGAALAAVGLLGSALSASPLGAAPLSGRPLGPMVEKPGLHAAHRPFLPGAFEFRRPFVLRGSGRAGPFERRAFPEGAPGWGPLMTGKKTAPGGRPVRASEKPAPGERPVRASEKNLALFFLGAALFGRLAAPDILGFTALPLVFALRFAIKAGSRAWRQFFTDPLWASVFAAAASLAALLALGAVKLPSLNMDGGRLGLAPGTAAILHKLEQPVEVTVSLGPQSLRRLFSEELAAEYARLSGGRVSFRFNNPQTESKRDSGLPYLMDDNSAEVKAENFKDILPAFSEEALNASLIRLMKRRYRHIYFLQATGEKMAGDDSPGGLAYLASSLRQTDLLTQDYYWPEGAGLPPEASLAVLAGPRAPLGELRETILLQYLKNGGRLLIMADPLTVALSPEFWANFGLEFKDGLAIDPGGNLAGTDESFVVARDYPAHPATKYLTRASLWPLAGAFSTKGEGRAGLPGAVTAALVHSSFNSWLETDAASLGEKGLPRYQEGEDLEGPLALAAATTLEGEGRLVALADSDLAANNFIGLAGNREFLTSVIYWLLDGEEALSPIAAAPQELVLARISARLFFWLPALGWPLFCLAMWGFFIRRKRMPDDA